MLEAIDSTKVLGIKTTANKADGGTQAVSRKARNTSDVRNTSDSALVQNAQKITEETREEQISQAKQLTEELNAHMEKLNTNIKFSFSDDTERLYVRVLEKNSGKLLREFPSEELRALAGYFKNAVGALFNEES